MTNERWGGNEVRRPEVVELAKKLHKQNPHWSDNKCLLEAKTKILCPEVEKIKGA